MSSSRMISIVTPCFNEAANVRELYAEVCSVMASLPGYTHEHLFIDNASRDDTLAVLRDLASHDPRVRVIVNSRNFGQLRSPYHALLQTRGDAVVMLVADFQDPPALIRDFVAKWEAGWKIVVAIKEASDEARWRYALRGLCYRTLSKLSEVELLDQFTGFGLYDRQIIEILRTFHETTPYFRGLVMEVGFDKATISYVQPVRRKGKTKNNLFSLFDVAMVGLVSHSRAPLRLATLVGFLSAIASISVALIYFVYKVLFWQSFTVGIAPLVIGLFLFSSVQLFFLGLLGEYIGAIHGRLQDRPLVIEKERINF